MCGLGCECAYTFAYIICLILGKQTHTHTLYTGRSLSPFNLVCACAFCLTKLYVWETFQHLKTAFFFVHGTHCLPFQGGRPMSNHAKFTLCCLLMTKSFWLLLLYFLPILAAGRRWKNCLHNFWAVDMEINITKHFVSFFSSCLRLLILRNSPWKKNSRYDILTLENKWHTNL